jgi:shikimate dehydrogenase
MKKYGLIGYPLGHSFSKKYFTGKFQKEKIKDCIYLNFPIESITKLPALISENKDLKGLNVTIPYKKEVIRYLDEIDNTAEAIGAVNTIRITRQNTSCNLKGYNTDAHGFQHSLAPFIRKYHKKALVLGTGGSSLAVTYVLDQLNIQYTYVSRNPRMQTHISYRDITGELMKECKIIINTTPLGMYPDVNKCADIPYNLLTPEHLLYDLVYNPEISKFLEKGGKQGSRVINGLSMLHLQAEKSWEIWNT